MSLWLSCETCRSLTRALVFVSNDQSCSWVINMLAWRSWWKYFWGTVGPSMFQSEVLTATTELPKPWSTVRVLLCGLVGGSSAIKTLIQAIRESLGHENWLSCAWSVTVEAKLDRCKLQSSSCVPAVLQGLDWFDATFWNHSTWTNRHPTLTSISWRGC